ncbi:MAG: bacillithiol biosynthesis cysteine-adding enzyme BshC [Bacteroidetes bacterium]|nr:bacillithiol biosynthesis cysteine-adding enzyme BshC [Bacteroidota bacterium]
MLTVFDKISLEETKRFSKLFIDYIHQESKISEFYKFTPTLPGFKAAIDQLNTVDFDRETLATEIKKQYAKTTFTETPNINELATKLLSKKTFTVCTGHQLCVLGGPLYWAYKICSTIKLAKQLEEAFPEYNFIPTYWLASEDHDFEEINHLSIFGQKLTWTPTDYIENTISGSISTSSISNFIAELKGKFQNDSSTQDILTTIELCYTQNKNLADATRAFAHHIFKNTSLLVIDGNNKELKKLTKNLFTHEINSSANIRSVTTTAQHLESLGYHAQVNARETNLFYIENNIRYRIDKTGASEYKTNNGNKTWSKETILKNIEETPECFSPNVIIRPMYQQVILPNIAYVGGPAEIAYWLEYKQLFESNNVFYPVLVSRNNALVLDAKSKQIIDKLSISASELFEQINNLVKKYVLSKNTETTSTKNYTEELKSIYDTLKESTHKIDPTIIASIDAEFQKSLNGLNNIENKIAKALKKKEEVAVNQLQKLNEKSFPNNTLQERNDSFIYFFAQFPSLINDLLSLFNPLEPTMYIITEK